MIKKRILDKIIKKSAEAVRQGGLGIQVTNDFSYRGFRVSVTIETRVIREYELPPVQAVDSSK